MIDCLNKGSEALLSWYALNGLVVMKTLFEKKEIYMYITQHLGSKKWYCIDHNIMREVGAMM